ncbi:MAG: hypothetical protein OER88_02720, partial [Planctomycetota bacterium]|nr:hypothetical protein [Planctomycetota bacterium]
MAAVDTLFRHHAGVLARGRGVRWGRRVFLIGAVLLAGGLFLERAGFDVPGIALPVFSHATTTAEQILGTLFVSIAGLIQGLFWLGVLFVAGIVVRLIVSEWRPPHARVAALLDRVLLTDRFAAAAEASGPLAGLAERGAVQSAPSPRLLRPKKRRRDRWLKYAAILAVLLVALSPGTASGDDGVAPMAGAPDAGSKEEPLRLMLRGDDATYPVGAPVPVDVSIEADDPMRDDFDEVVSLRIDGRTPRATAARLFLAAGAPGDDAVRLDLRNYTGALEPGEHEAVATAGALTSNVYRFTIEAPGASPKRKPKPDPEAKPQPDPKGGKQNKPDYEEKFVEPLVQDGEKVKKKARVPVE